MTFLISSIGSSLVNERGLGFSEGHEEIIGFVKSLLKRLQENGKSNLELREIEKS
jgi:hypothetical protein